MCFSCKENRLKSHIEGNRCLTRASSWATEPPSLGAEAIQGTQLAFMVLKSFLTSVFERGKVSYFIPAGQRVYAIGDIHGRLDLLDQLLAEVRADDDSRGAAETMLLFLGDLVDRGPDSSGVIRRLMELRESGTKCRFLLGNHDEVFLKAARGEARAMRFLTRIGGKETILSYGLSVDEYQKADYPELVQMLVERVPPSHTDFLSSFENYVEIGDYLFVHAGIKPGIEIANQDDADMRWIRGEFLNCRDSHGKMVVHGHTISTEPQILPNRIGIDTGAFASGRLTALGLESDQRWFLHAQGPEDKRWPRVTD